MSIIFILYTSTLRVDCIRSCIFVDSFHFFGKCGPCIWFNEMNEILDVQMGSWTERVV
jgi:hypothetical protein